MTPTEQQATPQPPQASDLELEIRALGEQARTAGRILSQLTTDQKNQALEAMAASLEAHEAEILEANQSDLKAAQERGLSDAMTDRLVLDAARLAKIVAAVREVQELPDPVGRTLDAWERPNGLHIEKKSTPIGVIGIIYESRPNVTVHAATLCFKAGNATLLRGGSEAIHSNRALAKALASGCSQAGVPAESVQLVPFTDRAGVRAMCELDDCLDVIIPRGGHGLIETVVSLARMPVIKHYDGICHVYVDKDADLEMAARISINAKCQRPGVCNAMETLLVHRDVAEAFLTQHGPELTELGVELRTDPTAQQWLPATRAANVADWKAEYLDLILSIKVVDSTREAIDHIERYGSSHTDAIVTDNQETAQVFLEGVNSASVFWNASPRFADGFEYGFGAEIGISTDRLHARGPMGLEELTIYKYLVTGNGQTRS